MIKKDLEKSLSNFAGGALVTITDICMWSGRSRDYVRLHITHDLDCLNRGTAKFYYAGDVAEAIVKAAG